MKPGVTLLGDGSAVVKITANGVCGGTTTTCSVEVKGGGVIDGFTIDASGSGVGVFLTAGDPKVASVNNVVISGAKGDGISATVSADLKDVSSQNNGGAGLNVSAGNVHVLGGVGVVNNFDQNLGDGINVTNTGLLTFDGGTASDNKGNGISLTSVPSTIGAVHTIKGAEIMLNGYTGVTPNGNSGIVVGPNSGLKLRSSTLLENGHGGLIFQFGATSVNTLDLGTVADPGNNTFATATPTSRNGKVGICLSQTSPSSVQADGDKWSLCPVAQTAIGKLGTPADCASITSYIEVAYKSKLAGDPLLATSCKVAP
ncbi:MAG: hypothetical protein NVS3B20_12460 [Polyangiales bacterium]